MMPLFGFPSDDFSTLLTDAPVGICPEEHGKQPVDDFQLQISWLL
jgi:hypothetical protein